jgi:hypothetical protein
LVTTMSDKIGDAHWKDTLIYRPQA